MIYFISSIGQVELPNPQLGDPEQLNVSTKLKITMGKDVHSTINPHTDSTFLLTFSNLTTENMLEFKTWFQNSRGLVHTYVDYNSVWYEGFIMNEPVELIADGRRKSTDLSGCSSYNEHWGLTIQFKAENL